MLDLRDFGYNRKYSDAYITHLIVNEGYIPVASGAELNALRNTTSQKMGAGTIWEGAYTTGVDKKYIQVRNIDLSDYQVGIGFASWGNFTGEYRGNNLKIKGLYMNNTGASSSLIEPQSGSIITDIVFEDFDISAKGTTSYACIIGDSYGYISNLHFRKGVINSNYRSGCIYIQRYTCDNCSAHYVKSYVANGLVTNCFAGSLFCAITNTDIPRYEFKNCFSANNTIIAEFNAGVSCAVGGFVGFIANNTKTINCYSLNDYIECKGASSSKYVAGFGYAYGSNIRTNCFSASKVKLIGSGYSGGFSANINGTIINCYYDSDVSGQSDTNKGLPRTTAQMLNGTADSFILANGDIDPDSLAGNAMYTGWDESIWRFHNNKYPKIKRQ